MTRSRMLILRVLVVSLLLATLGGNIADADGTMRVSTAHVTPLAFPDDPGFIP